MFVLTVDQRHSRRTSDRVEALLRDLADRSGDLERRFERTAGDEVQAVVSRPEVVADLVLGLVRDRVWSVGVGIGPVDEPLAGQHPGRLRRGVQPSPRRGDRRQVADHRAGRRRRSPAC